MLVWRIASDSSDIANIKSSLILSGLFWLGLAIVGSGLASNGFDMVVVSDLAVKIALSTPANIRYTTNKHKRLIY